MRLAKLLRVPCSHVLAGFFALIVLSACGPDAPDIDKYIVWKSRLTSFEVTPNIVLKDVSERGGRGEQPVIRDLASKLREQSALQAANVTYTRVTVKGEELGSIEVQLRMYEDAKAAQTVVRSTYALFPASEGMKVDESLGDFALGTYAFGDLPTYETEFLDVPDDLEFESVSFTLDNVAVSFLCGRGSPECWSFAGAYHAHLEDIFSRR